MRAPLRRITLAAGAVTATCLGAALLPAALGPRYGGEVVVAVHAAPTSLGPGEPASAAHVLALGLVHDRLLEIGPSGELRPRLASGWERTDDDREWLLHLAAGRCHDDRPVTAEAVVASLHRFLRSTSAAGVTMAASLEEGDRFREGTSETLSGVAGRDERSVVLRFAPGAEPSLAPLASWAAAITSVAGAPCGPFRAPVTPTQGAAQVFVASHGHWAGRPFLDRVILAVGQPEGEDAKGDDRATVTLGDGAPLGPPQPLILWIGSRVEARRDLAACDWRILAERFLPGGTPLPGLLALSAQGSIAAAPVPSVSAPRMSPSQASGTISLAVGADVAPTASQRVAAQMLALGFEPRVRVVPPDDVRESEADARLGVWLPDVRDPALILRQAARAARSDLALDACDQASQAADPTRRLQLLQEAARTMADSGAVIPLGMAPLRVKIDGPLRDVVVDHGGRLALEDAWLAP